MTAIAATIARRADVTRVLSLAVVAVAGLAIGRLGASSASFRVAATASLVVLVIGLWATRPRALLVCLVVWLFVLGLVRRLVSEGVAPLTGSDPLLLVGALALLLLATSAVEQGAFRPRTSLSKAVILLSVLIGLGAANPLQGNLRVGLTAIIFFVPVVAFWVGRRLVDDAILWRVLAAVAVLAMVAALYGLAQVFVGFPSWDRTWIAARGYQALNVDGVIRPFATFSSAQECALYVAVGIALAAAAAMRRGARTLSLAAVGLLGTMLFYESSRGIVFLVVGTGALMVCAKRRVPVPVALLGAAVAIVALPFVVQKAVSLRGGSIESTEGLVSHQLRGLADPRGADSTARGHAGLVYDGLSSAIDNPLGRGISVVTIAADRTTGNAGGTEADPSNAAAALGVPGLVAYLLIVWYGFRNAYLLAMRRGDALALAALGILGVTFAQWLNGGLYAVAFLPWLVLGWVDARSSDMQGSVSPRRVP